MKYSALVALFLASRLLAYGAADDARAALQSAIAAEKAGKIQAAIQQFQAILQKAPPPDIEGQARLELVRIHETRHEWWQAAEQLQKLRILAPGEAEYAYQLGVVYRSLSKSAFERMQAIAPQSARVQQMFGEQYALSGDSRKAIAAYQRAIQADPRLPGSHLAIAVIYLRERKRSDALSEVGKELEIAPTSAVAKQMRQAILGSK
jgi:tetratricopeptide (TPR) repeat protein